MKKTRFLCLLLTLCLLFAFLPSISASALTLSYEPSAAYRASDYYKKLQSVELTGSYHKDIVAVAKTQVGYHEGNGESELHGRNQNGTENFTEYGSWYGLQSEWCAIFISWCARQAGIPLGVVGKTGWADAADFGVEYRAKKDYTPVPGDIIVFDREPRRTYTGAEEPDEFGDHVGIVTEVTSTTVHTVEGNSSNACRANSYSLENPDIKGYGVYPDAPYPENSPKTSKWYRNSDYYTKLQAVEKTGNYHTDLASVALSQVGYHEGDYLYQVGGAYLTSDGDYTEYGYWYGYHTAWSAIFVSWRANRAGIPESVLTPTSWSKADDFGLQFEWAADHTPVPGDIVIFDDAPYHEDTDHPGAHGDRCGIVVEVTNAFVVVVEGSSSDAVEKNMYLPDDAAIKGYAFFAEPEPPVPSEDPVSEPSSASEEPAEPKETPLYPFILGGIALLALIACAAVLIVKKRKTK